MHITIDVREACCKSPAGKGMWVRGCVSAMVKKQNYTYTLLTNTQHVPKDWRKAKNVQLITLPRGVLWHIHACRYLCKNRPNLYISTTSFLVPAILRKKIPYMLVIHDLIAFKKNPHNRKAALLERLLLKYVLKFAQSICCISNTTKKDLVEMFPESKRNAISVVYAGPTFSHVRPNASDEKTIFYISTLCPRKNQLGLIQAYRLLPEKLRMQYDLVLAGGRGWHDSEIVDLAQRTKGVRWIGYITDDEYRHYLETCAVFAYPSFYEGFGIPILDAMQHGAAVITSRCSSTAEIGADAVLQTDPNSNQSLATDLEHLLTNSQLQQTLREKGPGRAEMFSWEKTAHVLRKTVEKNAQS